MLKILLVLVGVVVFISLGYVVYDYIFFLLIFVVVNVEESVVVFVGLDE